MPEQGTMHIHLRKNPASQAGFEPFVATTPSQPESNTRNRFINNYDGPYATMLRLNRVAIERFIELSGFDGIITLASLPCSRNRTYLDINPDATASAKKGLRIGQRRLEDEENPYYKVNATADGWAVQINGQKILEEIQDKPSRKTTDDVRFARRFNDYLRGGLTACVRGETMSNAKDEIFNLKLWYTCLAIGGGAIGQLISPAHLDLTGLIVTSPFAFAVANWMISRGLEVHPNSRMREGLVESFLPPVRIDDYTRGRGYLGFRGRTLVMVPDSLKK